MTSKKQTPRLKAVGKQVEKQTPRLKAVGTDLDKEFIELCLGEVSREGYQGTSLKSISWANIIKALKSKFNIDYTQRQLKNKWDYLRKCYAMWDMLINRTGHGCDPVAGTFDWPDEYWDSIIEKYPDAKKFRYVPLEHRELLRPLFGGTLSTGVESFSNKHPIPVMEPRRQATIDDDANVFEDHIMEENEGESFNEYFNGYIYTSDESHPFSAQGFNASPSQSASPSQGTSFTSQKTSQRKRKIVDEHVMQKIDEMIEWVKNTSMSEKESAAKSYEDARLNLDELELLWLINFEVVLKSMKVLSDNDGYRHMFSKLASNDRKVAFLHMITKDV